MNELFQLMKWDAILLHRNRLFVIAGIVALMYVGLFYLFKPLGDLTNLLIVLIFNDPVVTGYLFAGVLWLFDKNQHTLEAISVLPISLKKYLLSKSILLSIMAVAVSLMMALSTQGFGFNWLHLIFAVFGTGFIFCLAGFIIASRSKNFNQFLMYSIPIFMISGVPLMTIFGFGNLLYFMPLPTTGGIGLLQATFQLVAWGNVIVCYVHLIIWSVICWRMVVFVTLKQIA